MQPTPPPTPTPHPSLDSKSITPPSLPSKPQCHRLAEKLGQKVNAFFLENWIFPSDKARAKFVAAGFPQAACYYFPGALDERIEYACELLAILFLIDGTSALQLARSDYP